MPRGLALGKMPAKKFGRDGTMVRKASMPPVAEPAGEDNLVKGDINKTRSVKKDASVKAAARVTKPRLGTRKRHPKGKKPAYVVAVGASAGGLEALEEFFRAIPRENDIAFVVIQHLSPDFTSMMDELLARHTDMKIHRAQTGVALEPGSIYLMIPRKNLIVENGKLKLLEPSLARGLNQPIDIMFESLAVDQKDKAIAIILSGAGRDGSRGIGKIKELGGYIMAQDETTAKFDSMPRSAAATSLVDYIGAPIELGHHVLRRSMHPDAKPLKDKPLVAQNSTKLEEVIGILRTGTEFDFTHYKAGTISRRIERRMGILQISNLDDYIDFLTQFAQERRDLARDMLIGVTRFFRDPEMWSELQQSVLRPMIKNGDPDAEFRAWVAACSSGEEAYSLAICIKEVMEELGILRPVKIFASDIDPDGIVAAGSGVFPERISGEVSAGRLQKYFTKKENTYEIARSIREMIIFARHNLLTDAPFTRLDMITCRNMMIYLEVPAQKQALANMHFSLKDSGRLFLGPSEGLGEMHDAFVSEIDTIKCYRKNPQGPSRLSVTNLIPSLGARLRQPSQHAMQSGSRQKTDTVLIKAFEYIAETISYPGMFIGADNHLIYSFGDLSKVAALPSGGFSSDVTRLVREELRTPLSAGLRRSATSREPVVYQDIVFGKGKDRAKITVRIQPLVDQHTNDVTFLAFFETSALAADEKSNSSIYVASAAATQEISNLEAELSTAKETLQATIEELETANEELQSSNEELIASNEELQSTNEELHSVNEELQTVNTEYQAKIDELTTITDDFENLLRSTNIGTIFLDNNLRIRKFTQAVCEVIDLVEHDAGRKIDQFRTGFGDAGFIDNVTKVLVSGKTYIQEVRLPNDKAFMMRILPFQSASRSENGVVITFVDITSLERASSALAVAEQQISDVFNGFPLSSCLMDERGNLKMINPVWSSTFEFSESETIGRHLNSLITVHQENSAAKQTVDIWKKLRSGEDCRSLEMYGMRKSGVKFPVAIHYNSGGPGSLDTIVIEDLSEKHASTKALKEAIGNLKRSNVELEQFGTVVAHDLKEPLRTVRGFAKLFSSDYGDVVQDQGREYLDSIEAGMSRMQDMIDDLLNFATVTSDESESIEVDFSKILLESKRILQTILDKSGSRLIIGDMPVTTAKPGQMLHVFQNLIENAIKYRSDSPPNILISSKRIDDGWRFAIQDNGIGIKEGHQDKIFNVFTRLHGRGKYKGTGIGLAIVKKIVDSHGGRIWVESEFGVGSTFFFTLKDDFS